jgi:hypothetical protein
MSLASTVVMALLIGLSGVVDAQHGTGTKPPSEAAWTTFDDAWATIRDGVFVDRAEWEARFEALDPSDEEQVAALRRVVRDQLALLDGLDLIDESTNYRIRCLWEAHYLAESASQELEGALTELLEGDRQLGEEYFAYGQESAAMYWQLRDEVDCSTAGEVAAFLGSFELGGGSAFRPVTGRRLEYDYVPSEGSIRMEGNAFRVDGDTTYETWEWSDPLLPPDLTNRMNTATFSGDWEGMVIVASLLFEGPEGYWTGIGQGRTWVLTGHGVYEGLSAILTTTADIEADTLTVEGAIYAGPLPPVPEPLEPALEPTPGAERPTPRPAEEPAPEPTEEPTPPPTEEPAVAPPAEDPG